MTAPPPEMTADHIESYVDTILGRTFLPDDLPYSAGCPNCHRGLVQGDMVPYGSTQVPLPASWCECVWEHGYDYVQEQVRLGELVLVDDVLQPPPPSTDNNYTTPRKGT